MMGGERRREDKRGFLLPPGRFLWRENVRGGAAAARSARPLPRQDFGGPDSRGRRLAHLIRWLQGPLHRHVSHRLEEESLQVVCPERGGDGGRRIPRSRKERGGGGSAVAVATTGTEAGLEGGRAIGSEPLGAGPAVRGRGRRAERVVYGTEVLQAIGGKK